ncbi:MAG: hypothetical protein JSS66_06160 [Armatimonadetes bacterium]|nr:hypothetical protein [Armatimonadota bacterium]
MLCQQMLMHDCLDQMKVPEYPMERNPVAVYAKNGRVKSTQVYTEVFKVPLQQFMSDETFMEALQLTVRLMGHKAKVRRLTGTHLKNAAEKMRGRLGVQLLVHTDQTVPVTSDLSTLRVCRTSLCPRDTVYVLLPPEYTGVYVERGNEQGMAFLRKNAVTAIEFDPSLEPWAGNSLLDLVLDDQRGW